MADPITIGAAVGWGVSALGWLASPIISRVLNKGFALLDFNASEKLKILDTQVIQLQRVMEVADESTYSHRLEPLLNKLKSAFYEAEDILDRFEYRSLKKQIQDAKSDGSKMYLLRNNFRSFISISPVKDEESGMSKLQLQKSLEKIESAISDSCKVLEQLNLPGISNGRRAVATSSRSAGITVGPPLRVIGRDQDRDNIIAMLHAKEDQCQANTVNGTCYSVIGIHGIAGSGKSTLARCVYDHEKKRKQEKMEGHFDIVMWIHVSQKFALDSIFSEMFEGATQKKCPKFNSLNVLKESLEEKLHGKRILLVADFGGCIRLAFSSDQDMMNLVNLRGVIRKADLDFPNVGRLAWLNMLPFFTIRKKQGYEPHQLKHLNKLQDKLQIHGLENVRSKKEALEVNLAGKEKLTELVLQWHKQSCTPEVQTKVLEGLCPSKYLERLDIRNYHGMTLPNWMMGEHNSGPKNLQELSLSGWNQLGLAPDFGAFIHLHSLKLGNCSWDALPGNMERLTSLKKLEIWGCMNMQSLGTLPKSLEEFTVASCNHEFMQSCITASDPNWRRIEHIPKKTFEITKLSEETSPSSEDGS
uniref:Uncharacterized protein n=1 Tax=Avena sativa TaxID=4498 RepID=A0ACD5UJR8_AVESA